MAESIPLPEPTKFEAAALIGGTALFWFSFAMVCIIGAAEQSAGAIVFLLIAFVAATWLYFGIFRIASRAKGPRMQNASSVLKFEYYKRAATKLKLPTKPVLTVLGTLLGIDVIAFVVLIIRSI